MSVSAGFLYMWGVAGAEETKQGQVDEHSQTEVYNAKDLPG